MKRLLLLVLSLTVLGFAVSARARADPTTIPEPQFLQDTGTHFSLPNPNYLNITIDSTAPIFLRLETGQEMISMDVESASGDTSTQISIQGLNPNTTYYKYEDDYHSQSPFATDADGSFTYTQDLATRHLVFIQPRSSTKFLRDDTSGGDCSTIGSWSAATKTCTLTTDITETIQIDSDNLTLDGNGHSLNGTGTGSAIYLFGRTGVTLKNLTIHGFYYGVHLQRFSNSNVIENVTSRWNTFGIYSTDSSFNTVKRNTFNNNFYGIYAYQAFGDQTYQNNFIDNSIQVRVVFGSGNSFSKPAPLGGNYWSTYDTPAEGCSDTNADGFCDSPLRVDVHGTREWWDYLPWTRRNSWAVPDFSVDIIVPSELTLNDDGWYAENPGELRARVTNNTAETLVGILEVSFSDSSRLIFGESGEAVEHPNRLTLPLPNLDSGQSAQAAWPMWVQPMNEETIVFTGKVLENFTGHVVGTGSASLIVPTANVHPAVIIPGLLGSWMNFDGEWEIDPLTGRYDNLLEELRFAGYEDNATLFTFPYDWRRHVEETGNILGAKIEEFLLWAASANAAGRTYVEATSVDIVSHSLGGLVARSYIQGNAYQNNVHRLITLGTPHRGAPQAYIAAEGLEFIDEGFSVLREITAALFRSLAKKAGFCTDRILVFSQGYVCWPTDADLHRYILERVPSAREILPDRSYLRDVSGGYLVSESDPNQIYPFGVQVNSFLESLNENVGLLFSRLAENNLISVVGDSVKPDTDSFYRVEERNTKEVSLWNNGKVRREADFRPQGRGDQTVPIESSNLSVIDSRSTVKTVNSGDNGKEIAHGNMPTQLQNTVVDLLTSTKPFFDRGFLVKYLDPPIQNPLVFYNLSPVEMQIVDPQGRLAGVDFTSGIALTGIPGVFFSRSDLPQEPDLLFIPNPLEGDYTFNLQGTSEGTYTVGMMSLSESGPLILEEFTGTTSEGATHEHVTDYQPQSVPDSALTLEWLPPLGDTDPYPTNRRRTLPIEFTIRDEEDNFIFDESIMVWVTDPDEPRVAIASFTVEGPGLHGQSDIIKIDTNDEKYHVNLHLGDYEFESGKTYIINTGLFGQELGKVSFIIYPT